MVAFQRFLKRQIALFNRSLERVGPVGAQPLDDVGAEEARRRW